MKCMFCEYHIESNIASYQVHIRFSHNVRCFKEFLLSLFLLDAVEIEEVTQRLSQRLLDFENTGSMMNTTCQSNKSFL